MEQALYAQEVLLLDCQTTGATPSRGHLLEVAWVGTTASALSKDDAPQERVHPEAMLVSLPPGATISRRITTLTGIDSSMLTGAKPAASVWEHLVRSIDSLRTSSDGRAPVPTVIHFARFEEPFLRALHIEHGERGSPFPLELICTHTIAQALVANLPRRGLRALAGYFGYVMTEHKRAGSHVVATAVVWSALVRRLKEDVGINDLSGLRQWLPLIAKKPRPQQRGTRAYPLDREIRLGLPDQPGVYRMIARGGGVLYVGKATSLQKRVNSYFQKRRHDNTERTLELLTQVRDVDITVTASPLEAALLETDEIKRLAPPYNKALRGEKHAWFASLDGSATAPRVDDMHPIGPLPGPDAVVSLSELSSVYAHRKEQPSPKSLRDLRIGPSEQLDTDCAAAGLRLFATRYGLDTSKGATFASLLRLGATLWRRYLEESDDEQQADRDPADRSEQEFERPWDEARVVEALESMVRHQARLVRRGHLLCILSESTVAYSLRGDGDQPRRLLVIERGFVTSATTLAEAQEIPSPPGAHHGWRQRQRAFDGATLDRLRVLTTELRRLVSDGTPVEVRLGPKAFLSSRGLERRLRWV